MFYRLIFRSVLLVMFLGLAFSIGAQTKMPKKPVKKKPATETIKAVETPIPEKLNTRPKDATVQPVSEPTIAGKKNSKAESSEPQKAASQTKSKSVYFYEFSNPDFTVAKILIEHDENGLGRIRFLKKYYDEEISDPMAFSAAYTEKVKLLWQNLNFLDSSENYQYERDYSHLGKLKFSMKKDGRERTAEFNWTSNPDAKSLMDEYRRISNQYIWIFDMNLSRENQPLESSKIINSLDSQISRKEIADPEQMIPYLKDLGDDERIPLLSRNHAKRIVAAIQKSITKKP